MYPRMHPAMLAWWRQRQSERGGGECGSHAGVHEGEGRGHHHERGGWEASSGDEGESFGVRRPLRFLAYKLGLDEKQVADLATVLNELKTERAQASVDNRRVTAAFADAIAADVFDEAKVAAAAAERVKSAERLRDAVAKALGKIHASLDPDQRQRLAYLIRTGTLTI